MKKNRIQWMVLAAAAAVLFGCAASETLTMPGAFSAKTFDSAHYTSKVDNFIAILDASSSMGEPYNGQEKFVTAKAVLDRMNRTLPP